MEKIVRQELRHFWNPITGSTYLLVEVTKLNITLRVVDNFTKQMGRISAALSLTSINMKDFANTFQFQRDKIDAKYYYDCYSDENTKTFEELWEEAKAIAIKTPFPILTCFKTLLGPRMPIDTITPVPSFYIFLRHKRRFQRLPSFIKRAYPELEKYSNDNWAKVRKLNYQIELDQPFNSNPFH